MTIIETKIKEGLKYHPMLVGRNALGGELIGEEFNDFWNVFDTLPEETKDILTAPEMSERIERLQKDRGLSDDLIEIISAIIREYFVFKKDSLWLENALLAKLERKDVSFVKDYIQKNILTIKPVPKVSEEEATVASVQTISLPLLDALAKYQRLSEQTVTEDRLVVKGESVPVRGSVRNWLRNYRDNVGIRKHSTVERGQFLFQSENTKRLESAERERLSLLLRSLDENIPVSIDVERQEIVFPAFEERGSAPLAPSEGTAVPALETSFRPLEKFPAQAAPIRKALEWDTKSAERTPISGTVPAPTAPVVPAPRAKETVISNSPLASGGNISFSSSHVLPSEKENNSREESHQHAPEPEASRSPEAISIIRPRGNQRDFRGGVGSDGGSADDGFDAPRVVDLRNPGGIPNDKF